MKVHREEQITTKKGTYQKPAIIHSTSIETVAGRCSQSVGCTPSFNGHDPDQGP
ncbi:hypothetical protein JW935_16655 [candidate division KSB1 bacterium]|nr:hypothetical protein [candidate division KSB1 bacterium]